MAGPLVNLDTLLDAVDYNIDRALYLGNDSKIELLIPDADEVDGWNVVQTITASFNRTQEKNEFNKATEKILFFIADTAGGSTLSTNLRKKNLSLRSGGEIFDVAQVDDPEPNKSQVFVVTCIKRKPKQTHYKNR